MDVVALLAEIESIGRLSDGGYRRFALTDAEAQLNEWFDSTAASLGLAVEEDRNGNRWAWWGDPSQGSAIATGSHLDSVSRGGAYDGPLGIASAFAAVARLKAAGKEPTQPLAVSCFTDEEGGRFGVACLGSRLAAGKITAERALGLRDDDGISMAEAVRARGRRPAHLGPDPQRLQRVATFIELHVEQGRGLVDTDHAVAVGTAVWPHGRWRVEFSGRADHAGTAHMDDRVDPMLHLAQFITVAKESARARDTLPQAARATVGRVQVLPNAVNAIPARVLAWLDARASSETLLDELIEAIVAETNVQLSEESRTPRQVFDPSLGAHLSHLLGDVPLLDSGAGHDAGVLADAGVSTAMLFVRNPTGISHAPEEFAEEVDLRAGVDALTAVLSDLLGIDKTEQPA